MLSEKSYAINRQIKKGWDKISRMRSQIASDSESDREVSMRDG